MDRTLNSYSLSCGFNAQYIIYCFMMKCNDKRQANKLWIVFQDISMIVAFFIRNQMLFAPTFGGWGAFGLYMFARYVQETYRHNNVLFILFRRKNSLLDSFLRQNSFQPVLLEIGPCNFVRDLSKFTKCCLS